MGNTRIVIIENQYGSVDFSIDFSKYKKIGLKFSGGCDSTLLLYLLLSEIVDSKTDVKIIPITAINTNKGKWKLLRSQEILDYLITQEFPGVEHRVEERQVIYITDQQELRDFGKQLIENEIIDLDVVGMTCNPPHDIMTNTNLLDERPIGRDRQKEPFKSMRFDGSCDVYFPFVNVDKRWIAQCYHDFGLMDIIYPLTVSCERLRETSDMQHNEEPCGHCWWCREKKMAFGMLDFGAT